MRPETVIVIPNYNGKHLLEACLFSLRAQTYRNFKTIIADDGSSDGSIAYLAAHFPEVELLQSKKNRGFAKTVNRGLRFAEETYHPRYIAVLNNDTRAEKGWLEALVKRMHTDQNIAAATSNMLFFDHPGVVNSHGGTLDWNSDGYDIDFGIPRNEKKEKSRCVLGSCWGAALVRVNALRAVGALDETFNAYFEDLDWSWRATIFGYKIFFEKNAIIYHKHSASYRNREYKKLFFCKRNALRAAIKNYENKNLARQISYILIGYWFAIVGYFQTNKYLLPFRKKIMYATIPLFSILWNIFHLPSALRARSVIQKKRKRKDKTVFDLVSQDLTPVREWLNNVRHKIPRWSAPLSWLVAHAEHRVFLPLFNRAKHRLVLPLYERAKHKAVLPLFNHLGGVEHRIFLPLYERAKHRAVLPIMNRLRGTHKKERDMARVYLNAIFANLPFSLAHIQKKELTRKESALAVDACIACLGLSWYRERENLGTLARNIKSAGIKLKRAQVNFDKAIAFGKTINALSQLYFYLRLIEESGEVAFPKNKMAALRGEGSRAQNMLLDRIHFEMLRRGKLSFPLKLYSKMYLEPGLIKYFTTRAHSLYNNRKGETYRETYRGRASIELSTESIEAGPRYIAPRTPARRLGVNIFGFLDSESGVGEAARSLVRAVAARNIPYALLNSPRCPHRREDNQFTKQFGSENPYGINIITYYGDVFEDELRAWGKEKFEGRYNIAYWAWELSSLPASWTALLNTVDEVWTPSSFSAAAIRDAKRGIPVTVIPHPIELIKKHPYPRAHFGLPNNLFLFLFMFDFYSIFERKNPLAAIRAFKKAFRPDEPAGLVIKSSNHAIDPEHFAVLRREAESSNIFLLNDYLKREELSSIMNVCDAYVSLHRSEGFGLTIAEAMALGKPVIATDYSGNTDFMNEANSFPIPFTLVPLEKDYGPYRQGNVWANPDETKAAEAMRLAFDHREIAKRKGMLARRDIIAHLSPPAVANIAATRLDRIERILQEKNKRGRMEEDFRF